MSTARRGGRRKVEGYVDVRVAAEWLVKTFGLDADALAYDKRRAPSAPLARVERERVERERRDRALSKDVVAEDGTVRAGERTKLERALDEVLFDERSGVGIVALLRQLLFERRFEIPTARGMLRQVVVGDPAKVAPAVRKTLAIMAARHRPNAKARAGHPRQRGAADTLRLIRAIVTAKAPTRPNKAIVYLAFVLLGPAGLTVALGLEPCEGEDHVAFLKRASKKIDDDVRDRTD